MCSYLKLPPVRFMTVYFIIINDKILGHRIMYCPHEVLTDGSKGKAKGS